MKVARAGDRSLLIDVGEVSARELHAYAAAARRGPGVIACTPGQRSLFVVFDREAPLDFVVRPGEVSFTPRVHEVPVRFDGEDFDELLRHAGITPDEFRKRIPKLTARYLGFRGGWAYLDGWPAAWAMPRRPTSRPVKRGSFAIAGTVAGFYTIDTPGGWNILGRTDLRLDIAPGDEIVILPTERDMGLPPLIETPPPPDNGAAFTGNFAAVVKNPFDPELAAYANRLVANRDEAPILECAMLGPKVRLAQRSVVAWAGADSEISGVFEAEGELNVGRIRNGLRGWLAIGNEIRDAAPPRRTDRLNIRVLPGPHESPIRKIECEVTPQLNRVGIRLKPLTPLKGAPADLPSCGMQFGTIQLHPDGSLVAMGPDHPMTGGYLQPLTVLWDERWKLAQLTPGERVVFRVD